MSVAFTPHRQRGKGDITPAGIQKVIDRRCLGAQAAA